MGYVVATEDVNFIVPAEHAETALATLQALNLASPATVQHGPVAALANALTDDIGFDVLQEGGGVQIICYKGESDREDEVIVALAPFVADASYIEWRGEAGDRWRDLVRGAKVHSQHPSDEWIDTNPAQPPQLVTAIPVMYRDQANYKVYGQITCDGVITPSQVVALTAALDDGLYYVPLQLGLSHWGSGAWSSFPCEDDHGWHEMHLTAITTVTADGDTTPASDGCCDYAGSVDEFVKRVQDAAKAGWKPGRLGDD